MVSLRNVEPKTKNQSIVFEEFDNDRNLFIHGCAGTGKSFISMYLGLDSILNDHDSPFRSLSIFRSCVPAREQGFLPGSQEEKDGPYEAPYEEICGKLFSSRDKVLLQAQYKVMKDNGLIRFHSTSYLRGITVDNSIMLIDEVQNMNFGEINSVITRAGYKCKIIICGDSAQNDLMYLHEDSCIDRLRDVIPTMKSFKTIEMTPDDIVRNDVVREWIIANNKYNPDTIKNVSFLRD